MSRLTYNNIVSKESKFLALTSLVPQEFLIIVEETERVFQENMKTQRVNGKARYSRKYTDYKNSPFNNKEDRLLLPLVYLKNNLTQEILSEMFETTQPKINIWLKTMLICLKQALRNLEFAPARDNKHFQKLLEKTDSPLFVMMQPSEYDKDQRITKPKKRIIAGKRKATRRKMAF